MDNWKQPFKRPEWRWPGLFFLLYLGLGLGLFGDYGMSWDEELQRQHGLVAAQYIKQRAGTEGPAYDWRELSTYQHRHYGVVFSLPMAWLERAMGLDTPRQQYRMRHLGVFLLYWLSSLVFYQIVRQRFGHWSWGLLAAGLWVLSPRLFGHSFFNPKDIPLLALYVSSTWTLYRFWLRPGPGAGLLHALACGALIGMRVLGVFVPMLTLFLFAADAVLGKRGTLPSWQRRTAGLLVYLPALAGATVLFWPFLWEAPLARLAEAFSIMADYQWPGKVLFMGAFYTGAEVPWYYLPTWLGISVPLLYLALAAAGLAGLAKRGLAGLRAHGFALWSTGADRKDWAALGLFLGPLVAIWALGAVVYDGWRHVFFIYPSLLYLAVLGVYQLWHRKGESALWRRALRALLAGQMLFLVFWMARNHPHQQVFFNALARGNQLGHFDLDYWGTAYKQGLEYLASQAEGGPVKVAYASYPATLNHAYLEPKLRSRIQLVEEAEKADFYISDFRLWESGLQQALRRSGPYAGEEVHAIYIGQAKALGIYKLHGQ